MILSLTNTGPDAADLGYLLHKNPVEVDPIDLVRSRGARQAGWALGQYLNDRPYLASSFLSTAISRVFDTALNGTCNKRRELVAKELDLTARLPVLPAPGGIEQPVQLFGPLGYAVTCRSVDLDPIFPTGGRARVATSPSVRKRTSSRSCSISLFSSPSSTVRSIIGSARRKSRSSSPRERTGSRTIPRVMGS